MGSAFFGVSGGKGGFITQFSRLACLSRRGFFKNNEGVNRFMEVMGNLLWKSYRRYLGRMCVQGGVIADKRGSDKSRLGRMQFGESNRQRKLETDEESKDLCFDSGYRERGGQGTGGENREGIKRIGSNGKSTDNSSKEIDIGGGEDSELCSGVSAGTSKVYGVLHYNRCGKSEKM